VATDPIWANNYQGTTSTHVLGAGIKFSNPGWARVVRNVKRVVDSGVDKAVALALHDISTKGVEGLVKEVRAGVGGGEGRVPFGRK